ILEQRRSRSPAEPFAYGPEMQFPDSPVDRRLSDCYRRLSAHPGSLARLLFLAISHQGRRQRTVVSLSTVSHGSPGTVWNRNGGTIVMVALIDTEYQMIRPLRPAGHPRRMQSRPRY